MLKKYILHIPFILNYPKEEEEALGGIFGIFFSLRFELGNGLWVIAGGVSWVGKE